MSLTDALAAKIAALRAGQRVQIARHGLRLDYATPGVIKRVIGCWYVVRFADGSVPLLRHDIEPCPEIASVARMLGVTGGTDE
jgi:hypothetical protein